MPEKTGTVSRLARRAALTTLAGGFALTPGQITTGEINPSVSLTQGSLAVESVTKRSEENVAKESLMGSDIVSISVRTQVNEWTPALEKEFRILAAQEAAGALTGKALGRLNELNFLRDTLKTPRTPAEILLQMQRDKVIDKLSEALEEYVEFQKTSHQASALPKQKV